jgi:hypothetical protein
MRLKNGFTTATEPPVPFPLVLKKEEAKLKIKEALDKGELSWRQRYGAVGKPCAIGCLLPQDLRTFLDAGNILNHKGRPKSYISVLDLIRAGVLEVDDEDWFAMAQCYHDNMQPSLLKEHLKPDPKA